MGGQDICPLVFSPLGSAIPAHGRSWCQVDDLGRRARGDVDNGTGLDVEQGLRLPDAVLVELDADLGDVVTIAMDKVEFRRPVFIGDILSVFTSCVRHGRTSVTVRVDVWAESRRPPRRPRHVTEAMVTMVAVDESHKKVPLSEV